MNITEKIRNEFTAPSDNNSNDIIEIKKGSLLTVGERKCVVEDFKSINIQRDFISLIELPDEKDPDQTPKRHFLQLGKSHGTSDVDLWPVDDSLYTYEEQMQFVSEFLKTKEKGE